MPTEFKEGDCVMLKYGSYRQMTLTHLFEELNSATCAYEDENHKILVSEDFPLVALKHCPREVSAEERIRIMQEIIPPRTHGGHF